MVVSHSTSLKAVAGAAAGTLFGAWLTGRAQHQRELVAELRALRSLHSLCIATANKCIAIKKQQIRPLRENYDQARRDFDLYCAGPKTVPFNIQFEFHNLPNVEAPIETVEKLAFEKCDPGAKGLAATVELRSSLDAPNDTLRSRNKLLDELRSDPSLKDYDVLIRYFGLRDPEGSRTDERYKAMVDALDLQTNDAIFFARQLAAECIKHANLRAKKYRWRYRIPYKRLEPADWSKAIKEKLIPDDQEYRGWLSGFREEQPSRWRKILRRSPPA
jgi:hypothetical protein